MTDDQRSEMESLIRYTVGCYEFIGGGTKANLEQAITDWVDYEFGNEADNWWGAGCFDAGSTADMRDAGLTPDGVKGNCPKLDGNSWGYAYCNSDVSLADVIAACRG